MDLKKCFEVHPKLTSRAQTSAVMRLWSSVGGEMRFSRGWLAGWLVRLHWNAGSFVCLGEEWVRRRMPLMIAERKNEPPGSVLSVSAPPLSFSLSLYPFFFPACENLHRAEPLSAEATVPRHNRCFFLPLWTPPPPPPLLGAYVCQGKRNTGPQLLFLSASLPLDGCKHPRWMVNC